MNVLSSFEGCRIGVRHDGKGGKAAKMGTDGLLTSVPFFAKAGILTRRMSG